MSFITWRKYVSFSRYLDFFCFKWIHKLQNLGHRGYYCKWELMNNFSSPFFPYSSMFIYDFDKIAKQSDLFIFSSWCLLFLIASVLMLRRVKIQKFIMINLKGLQYRAQCFKLCKIFPQIFSVIICIWWSSCITIQKISKTCFSKQHIFRIPVTGFH